jgi:hypothetical protein
LQDKNYEHLAVKSMFSNIYQVDGNVSLSSSMFSDESDMADSDANQTRVEGEDYVCDEEDEYDDEIEDDNVGEPTQIPVLVTYRDKLQLPQLEYRLPVRRNILANNRVLASAELPVIATSNLRSLGPKINSVRDDILLRDIDVLLCSETWEKDSNRKLKKDIERIYQMDGLEYLSCPRPNNRRGGGAGVIVNTLRFSISKLSVIVPHKLECQWGLLRPKLVSPTSPYKEHIICAFYSPPNSKKNKKLLDHIISTMHQLLTKYPKAGYLIGGDKNSLPIAPIISALPKCQQIVTQNTYKDKILDIILTNMSHLYSVPYIAPAVQPDDIRHASPSDHNIPVAVPLAGAHSVKTREYSIKISRPLPKSGLLEFGTWVSQENWQHLLSEDMSSSQQVHIFESILQNKVDYIFPQKICRISNQDFSFITGDIKKLKTYLKREYNVKGKTEKYLQLKEAYDAKFKAAAENHLTKYVRDMMQEAPGKAYKAMKKMGARPGDCQNEANFTITEHINLNLSTDQSIARILHHFSQISRQYVPLKIELLPDRVKLKMDANINLQEIPHISPHQIYNKYKNCKKTKSSVPGDLPPRLRYEFDVELCEPGAIIYNNIARTGQWPNTWKNEMGTVLKKCTQEPENEDDLRIISLTNHFSKQMEGFIIDWLMEYIGDKMDRDQFGGQKGHSVSHYLIELINAIAFNQDLSSPHATMMAAVDLSKGFNKLDHTILLTLLSDMGVPGWLLKIVASYLQNRTLTIKHKGQNSETTDMPGGVGAGCTLGLFCFLVMFNFAGPPANRQTIGQLVTKPLKSRRPIQICKTKWIDDLSICVSLDLKSSLVPDIRPNIPRPVPYHGRTGHMLPSEKNVLNEHIDKIQSYTLHHLMSINTIKTKILLFNRMKNYDFIPEISIENTAIEVVEKIKVVGFILQNDLKTNLNTAYITSKAYSRMWLLRRLKTMGATQKELIDVLQKQILSVLQLAVPAWNSLLTKSEVSDIERVLKCGLHIIFGFEYKSYEWALRVSQLKTLEQQRSDMVLKFTKNAIKHDKFSGWFTTNTNMGRNTRSEKTKYTEVPFRTSKYMKTAIPVMTTIANNLTS